MPPGSTTTQQLHHLHLISAHFFILLTLHFSSSIFIFLFFYFFTPTFFLSVIGYALLQTAIGCQISVHWRKQVWSHSTRVMCRMQPEIANEIYVTPTLSDMENAGNKHRWKIENRKNKIKQSCSLQFEKTTFFDFLLRREVYKLKYRHDQEINRFLSVRNRSAFV